MVLVWSICLRYKDKMYKWLFEEGCTLIWSKEEIQGIIRGNRNIRYIIKTYDGEHKEQ